MINALVFYYIANWLYNHKIPILPKLLTLLIFLIYNCKVPYQAKIGKGCKLGYGGIGVVIHKDAIIGERCTISQQVTVGGGGKIKGLPIIGNDVYIAKGAIVFGGISVGNNVTIGANAVVNRTIPDNAIVAGVPAKIIRLKK